ncbi:MAG: ankyrin repeat domain-containing protein [Syntrophaceae bacterium]|nr:ankyrin repeat domain-containing protein [Syntrophaceae bacterium]
MNIHKILITTLLSIVLSINLAFAEGKIQPSADGDILIEAIKNNDNSKVDKLLSEKVNPNSRGYKIQFISPLKMAVSNNNKHIVESLIKYGANVKEKEIVCGALKNVEMVTLLINHGTDIRGAECGGTSPLHATMKTEFLDTAELLLKHGADINNQSSMGKLTPLHYAVSNGEVQAVRWLLEHGADINLQDADGGTAISLGTSHVSSVEIIKMLLGQGAKMTSQDITRLTKGACRSGNLDIMEFISSKGIKPDFDACYTALAYRSSPNQDVLKWVTGKAKIKNADVGKESLLGIAVENNNLDIVKLLIASGADVNKKDSYNSIPLAWAIEGMGNSVKNTDNYKEMFTLLLKHGANPNIMYGHKYARDNTKILLKELADINGCSYASADRPPGTVNKKVARNIEIAELLISFGANVNASDERGNTPLHEAAKENNIPMIKMLVSHGANLKATNKDRETPLHCSMIYGGSDISCKFHTIEALCSLEADLGGKLDWVRIKEVANRPYIQNKQQLITFIEKLEKDSSGISESINNDKFINKIIDDMPKTLDERLGSCDSKIALAAAEEIIKKPASLKEPLDLFKPALTFYLHGKKDEAVFWFYAAQLRVRYQLAFEKGDRGQLLQIMRMTIGPPILNYAFQNTSNLNRILDRVLEWDKKTPNPFREKPRSESINKEIDSVYAGMSDYKTKLTTEKNYMEQEARKAAPGIERSYVEEYRKRCQKKD